MKYEVFFLQNSGQWESVGEAVETRGMAVAYAKMTQAEIGTNAVVKTVAEFGSEASRDGKVVASFGDKALPIDWIEFELAGSIYRVDNVNNVCLVSIAGRWMPVQGIDYDNDVARKAFWDARSKSVYGA